MKTEIWREYTFEAAHYLPNVSEGHKCAAMHGHSYRVRVYFAGNVDPETGWLRDFGDIDDIAKPFISQLDHSTLNEHDGLSNPTSELLSQWLWNRIVGCSAVEVSETSRSGCTYRGEA